MDCLDLVLAEDRLRRQTDVVAQQPDPAGVRLEPDTDALTDRCHAPKLGRPRRTAISPGVGCWPGDQALRERYGTLAAE